MHGRFGRTVLLVYSRSPNWQSYIEARWLPRLVANAVVLDWSDRSTWRRSSSLVVRVFRHWAPDRDFNPMAILLPPRGRVRVLGFRRAFRDLKHGKEHSLRRAEAELFEFVERGR
ncbi:MAG TPA: hypothetical protein VKA21_08125 [Candidatus Binatia bacterium]|nr:hypothetical protein [Candidatus Binatia bacterium]